MRHWIEVRGKHIEEDEWGIMVAYPVDELGIIEAVSKALKWKERESKEAGLTYLEKLYKEDQQPAWNRMYEAETALEGLGIDVQEAQRRLNTQRKAA